MFSIFVAVVVLHQQGSWVYYHPPSYYQGRSCRFNKISLAKSWQPKPKPKVKTLILCAGEGLQEQAPGSEAYGWERAMAGPGWGVRLLCGKARTEPPLGQGSTCWLWGGPQYLPRPSFLALLSLLSPGFDNCGICGVFVELSIILRFWEERYYVNEN